MTRDYVGYVLAVISILVGTIVSWHFYEKSRQFKSPVFVVDIFPSTIYDANRESRLPFKVLREDGRVLEQSVHVGRHILWNKGNQAIASSDALTPIRVTISNADTEILSVSISEISREVVTCNVSKEGDRTFSISFRILEEGDGCAIKVIYSGKRFPKYQIGGDIMGVKRIEISSDIVKLVKVRSRGYYFTGLAIITVVFLLAAPPLLVFTRRMQASAPQQVFVCLLLALLLVSIWTGVGYYQLRNGILNVESPVTPNWISVESRARSF